MEKPLSLNSCKKDSRYPLIRIPAVTLFEELHVPAYEKVDRPTSSHQVFLVVETGWNGKSDPRAVLYRHHDSKSLLNPAES